MSVAEKSLESAFLDCVQLKTIKPIAKKMSGGIKYFMANSRIQKANLGIVLAEFS